MKIFITLLILIFILLVYKNKNSKKLSNKKINKFKNKLLSKESNIEKIFLRDEEKTASDPNININIRLDENEDIINRKSNIHRARLSKFKKSKLNGQIIFLDDDQNIFKYVDGDKIYL